MGPACGSSQGCKRCGGCRHRSCTFTCIGIFVSFFIGIDIDIGIGIGIGIDVNVDIDIDIGIRRGVGGTVSRSGARCAAPQRFPRRTAGGRTH